MKCNTCLESVNDINLECMIVSKLLTLINDNHEEEQRRKLIAG